MSVNTGKEEPEETREELFAKKVHLWQRQTRDKWEWKDRPSYRQKTVNAAVSQQRLEKQVKRDYESLEEVEAGLNAMSTFLEGKEEQVESSSAILESGINIDDMLQLKRSVKEKIKSSGRVVRSDLFKEPSVEIVKETSPAVAEEPVPILSVSVNVDPLSEAATNTTTRKPALLDMDGLKAARMHNKHRQMLLQQRKHGDGSSYVPSTIVSARNRQEPIEDFTFLTGIADTGDPEEEEEPPAKPLPLQPKPIPNRSVSAGPLRTTASASALHVPLTARTEITSTPSSAQVMDRSTALSMHNLHERPPIPPRHQYRHHDHDVSSVAFQKAPAPHSTPNQSIVLYCYCCYYCYYCNDYDYYC
jgi:hypothetical protein